MSVLTITPPTDLLPPPYRLTVEQYHAMLRGGILSEDDKVELLEGVLVQKMGKNPPHRFATQQLNRILLPMVPVDRWFVDIQEPVTTADSEPEPDVAVFRGTPQQFVVAGQHPGPTDACLVIEVSDSSLRTDRGVKQRIYARAGIPQYWIVNIVDRRVEVYTDPSGADPAPAYRQRRDFAVGDEVPVVLDGVEVGRVRVADLFA
ncbi:MAG: Uma2 family endonuclease [Gemmataceae bacterium]